MQFESVIIYVGLKGSQTLYPNLWGTMTLVIVCRVSHNLDFVLGIYLGRGADQFPSAGKNNLAKIL